MIAIDEKLLPYSVELRKKLHELRKMERDVRIALVFEEKKERGERYGEIVEELSGRFQTSVSTVKRAVRNYSVPPWKRRRWARDAGALG